MSVHVSDSSVAFSSVICEGARHRVPDKGTEIALKEGEWLAGSKFEEHMFFFSGRSVLCTERH